MRLEIRRSSASVWGRQTGLRHLPVVAKYIDTSTCIGCKACEVACQEWNDLTPVPTAADRHLPDAARAAPQLLEPHPLQRAGGRRGLRLADAQGPVHALRGPRLPRRLPGAGRHRPVRKRHRRRQPRSLHRLRLLRDRLPLRRAEVPGRRPARWPSARCASTASASGCEPACIKACPTGCLQFGTKDDMVALGQTARRAAQGQRLRQRGALRPAGRRRHRCRHRAGPRRPPGVVRLARATRTVPLGVRFVEIGAAAAGPRGDRRRRARRHRPLHELWAPRNRKEGAVSAASPSGRRRRASSREENVVVGDEIVRHRLASPGHPLDGGGCSSSSPCSRACRSGRRSSAGWRSLFGGLHRRAAGCTRGRACCSSRSTAVMFVHWLRRHAPGADATANGCGPQGRCTYMKHETDDSGCRQVQRRSEAVLLRGGPGRARACCVSGVVMWFPLAFPRSCRGAAILLHDVTFILFTVAIVLARLPRHRGRARDVPLHDPRHGHQAVGALPPPVAGIARSPVSRPVAPEPSPSKRPSRAAPRRAEALAAQSAGRGGAAPLRGRDSTGAQGVWPRPSHASMPQRPLSGRLRAGRWTASSTSPASCCASPPSTDPPVLADQARARGREDRPLARQRVLAWWRRRPQLG